MPICTVHIPYGTQIVMKQVLVTLRDSVKRFIAPVFILQDLVADEDNGEHTVSA